MVDIRTRGDVKPPLLDFYRVVDGARVEFKFSIDESARIVAPAMGQNLIVEATWIKINWISHFDFEFIQ